MKNVLITGGAGFIGSNIALRLASSGFSVRVLDNLSPQIHGCTPEQSGLYQSIRDTVEFIRGDVTSTEDMRRALVSQDAVIHLAAETGTGQSMYRIKHYSDVNIGGTALLLDLLANEKNSVKRVVVASSRSVYGEGKYFSQDLGIVYPGHRSAEDMSKGDFEVKYPGARSISPMPTDEDSKIHPSSVYGITKQNQEQLVMTVCPGLDIEPVALRYQNVYGPGQSLSNPYTGILSIFSNLIRSGKRINIFEDGTESRDFVYIDDVVTATVLALTKQNAAYRVFNVGTGIPIDVKTVAETLVKKLDGKSEIVVSGNFRLGDIRHNYADLSLIEEKLGFRPAESFNSGLSKFCDWVLLNEINSDGYENSLAEMRAKGMMK